MNKLVKITDTMFVWYMQWAPSTIQMTTKIIPGYMIKKVRNVYTWSPFIMHLKVFTSHNIDTVRIVHSTGAVQLQACPMMLLASV